MTMTASPPREKKDQDKAPTILAALGSSTREERAAETDEGKEAARTLASDLHQIMMRWAQHWEPAYLAADERWDFYDGRHWGYRSVALGVRIADPPASPLVKRIVMNYIRQDVERQVSIVLKDRPIIKAYSGDSEIMDQASSEASDDLIDWRQQRTNLCADPERVARNSAVAGWCWVHSEWDTTLGKMVPVMDEATGQQSMRPIVDPTGEMRMDPSTGAPFMEPVEEPEGDYAREILTHRQGVPDPSAKSVFGGSGFFIRKKMSRFDFSRRYPDLDVGDFPPSSDEKLNRSTTLMAGPSGNPGSGSSTDKDELDIAIFYAPKCVGYPKGARIIFTETQLVEEMDNPRYPDDEELAKGESEPNPHEEPCWPIGTYVFGLSEGTPLGFSPSTDAIPLNRAINGLVTTSLMHAALSKGKWKVPNDLAQELTDETAQIIKVSPRRFDPNTLGAISAPPMPPEYVTLWRELVETLHSFMWLNQPAVGSQQSAGDSGYKVRLQQQVADNNLEKVRERQNDMWAWQYEYELFLWRRHADAKRSILVIGENRAAEVRELDKTAIMPATNVRCAHNSFMPRDPSMKMAWFQQFMASGVMQLDPKTRQNMFEWIGAQNTDVFIDNERADVMRAKRQILRIMNDEDPGQVSDMDDHAIQLDIIRKFGLSQEFETKVRQELEASQQQIAAQPPPAIGDPAAMGGMAPPPPAQPMSTTFQRMMGLYQAHKNALVAQVQAQTPAAPPAAPGGMSAPPGGPSPPPTPSGTQQGA